MEIHQICKGYKIHREPALVQETVDPVQIGPLAFHMIFPFFTLDAFLKQVKKCLALDELCDHSHESAVIGMGDGMLQGPGKGQPDIPAVLLHILDVKIVVLPDPVADEPPQKIVFTLKICIEASAGNIRLLDDPVDGRGFRGRPRKFLDPRPPYGLDLLLRQPLKPLCRHMIPLFISSDFPK